MRIVPKRSHIDSTLQIFGGKVSVNGYGFVGSELDGSVTPRVPDEWAFLKQSLQGDYGTWVTWSFTKFLLDCDGCPVRRFEPGASLNEIRFGILETLHRTAHRGNGEVTLAGIGQTNPGSTMIRQNDNLNVSRRQQKVDDKSVINIFRRFHFSFFSRENHKYCLLTLCFSLSSDSLLFYLTTFW